MLNSFIFAAINYSKIISVLERIHSIVLTIAIPATIVLVICMFIVTFIDII